MGGECCSSSRSKPGRGFQQDQLRGEGLQGAQYLLQPGRGSQVGALGLSEGPKFPMGVSPGLGDSSGPPAPVLPLS